MEFGVNIPFVHHLGLVLNRFEGGESEILLDPKPEHLNSFSVVHGGVCMTLLDVAMAGAARSVQQDMGVVTIEMKTTFMQAARGKLSGKGRLMHRTATMAFTEATIYDAEGKPCAHATGTFKYVKRLPTGAASANALNVISTD
jgi:uncharacterized protein (TIGR00369 family)